jgi:integrase
VSVFKTEKSAPYFWFSFQISGQRFYGSTRSTNRKQAEKVETEERDKAKAAIKAQSRVTGSLAIVHVASRYWEMIGKHHAGADTTERDLNRLVDYFSESKLLTEITDSDVGQVVAWRRGQSVKGSKDQGNNVTLIAPATVNRSTTEVLKKLYTFAKNEGARFDHEPKWKNHFLRESQERVRELQTHEGQAIDAVMRADYAALFAFVQASGWRQGAAVTLKWSEVNFGTKTITKPGKGDKRITLKITPSILEIIWPLQGHHAESVFTYQAMKTRSQGSQNEMLVRGQRYPMTLAGVKTRWRRMRAAAGVKDFRFHDYRHDFATKLLRQTGNLKLVSKALGHADIKTTMKYAHVLDSEVSDAIEQMNRDRAADQGLVAATKPQRA